MIKTTAISIRQLQHNLANYIDLAKVKPVQVTKYGKRQVVILDPDKYEIVEKKSLASKPKSSLMSLPFVGMYKNEPEFEGKSALEIAEDLRQSAWYGK